MGGGVNYYTTPSPCAELIDFIYALTKDEDYLDGFASFKNAQLSLVATELVKRGVLSKKPRGRLKNGERGGNRFAYRWAANSEPTKHFAVSVAQTIAEKMSKPKTTMQTSEKPTPPPAATLAKSLDGFTNQELWDELKRRGAQIINGELAIVTKLC